MKIGFLGGGSLRLLPIIRSCMADSPQNFHNGEIRLIDLKHERSEAVARLIAAAPEFSAVRNCKISCPDTLDEGLKDLDVLYLTMSARKQPSETLALFESIDYGYFSNDQLTVNGAFLSLKIGFTILNIARKMEKLCPQAMMLIFPNPVAVYSCMVNTYTKIRALGICGGFNNHRYDLTRLCFGRNECDYNWNVVAAGVNHLSFILRGDYKGEDLFGSLFPKYLSADWRNPADNAGQNFTAEWRKYAVRMAMDCLYKCYRNYNTLMFSTEADGMAQLFPKETLDFLKFRFGKREDFNPEAERILAEETEKKNYALLTEKSLHPETIDWSQPGFFGRSDTDITVPLLRAVGGIEPMRIVATRPNYGAIADFPAHAAMEYSMDVFKEQVTPVENLYIPKPFKGLIASLSEHQTLLAEAIAEHDPKLFVYALEAYPQNQFSPNRKDFFLKMFDIHCDIDAKMYEARHFYE